MKYRKKPVVVEAEQFYLIYGPAEEGPAVSSVDAVYSNKWWQFWKRSKTGWLIDTLEGWHEVTQGDWIITGVKGEKYPCKPDIFEMTYEPVSQEHTTE